MNTCAHLWIFRTPLVHINRCSLGTYNYTGFQHVLDVSILLCIIVTCTDSTSLIEVLYVPSYIFNMYIQSMPIKKFKTLVFEKVEMT